MEPSDYAKSVNANIERSAIQQAQLRRGAISTQALHDAKSETDPSVQAYQEAREERRMRAEADPYVKADELLLIVEELQSQRTQDRELIVLLEARVFALENASVDVTAQFTALEDATAKIKKSNAKLKAATTQTITAGDVEALGVKSE